MNTHHFYARDIYLTILFKHRIDTTVFLKILYNIMTVGCIYDLFNNRSVL